VLLCVFVSGLWMWSYGTMDRLHWWLPFSRYHLTLATSGGRLGVLLAPYPPTSALAGVRFHYERRPAATSFSVSYFPNYRKRLGAELGWRTRGTYAAVVPVWWLLVPCGSPLVLAALRHIRARTRIAQGHCRRCGYDLRASPDRCPECGATATVQK
jgi:hypothetical protein